MVKIRLSSSKNFNAVGLNQILFVLFHWLQHISTEVTVEGGEICFIPGNGRKVSVHLSCGPMFM